MKLNSADLHGSVSDPVLDTMNFLNEITFRYPDAISFAPGRPYDGFFESTHAVEYIRGYISYLEDQGKSADWVRGNIFQYGPTAGVISDLIADWLRIEEGIEVPPESIVVTVGAQEAMLLVLRVLMADERDVLLVSSPCYVGITGAARLLDVTVATVEEQAAGLSLADLEGQILAQRARGRRPRLLHLVPDHANPSGQTMSLEARGALLELAERYELLILEDNPYRLMSKGPRIPTLKAIDQNQAVIYLGSFSKTIFPGARVGFAVADQTVIDGMGRTGLLADQLVKVKSMVTVNTSSLSQAVVAGALLAARGKLADYNAQLVDHYDTAMRLVLEHLERKLPAGRLGAPGVSWNRPEGGFFLRLNVPFTADDAALTRSATDFGVIWTPMSYFYPDGGGEHSIRLSISHLTAREIDEGTSRLARFIESESARS
jgi:(S)-3,5-dihydroxyphenylglycine transaminase